MGNRDTSRCETAAGVKCTFTEHACEDTRDDCAQLRDMGGCLCHGKNCDWPTFVVMSCPQSCYICEHQAKLWPWGKDSAEERGKDSGEDNDSKDSNESGGKDSGEDNDSKDSNESGGKDSGEENDSKESNESGGKDSGEETDSKE